MCRSGTRLDLERRPATLSGQSASQKKATSSVFCQTCKINSCTSKYGISFVVNKQVFRQTCATDSLALRKEDTHFGARTKFEASSSCANLRRSTHFSLTVASGKAKSSLVSEDSAHDGADRIGCQKHGLGCRDQNPSRAHQAPLQIRDEL